MAHIVLNKKEIALLKSAVRKGDENPDFQKFLVSLDQALREWTGQIFISDNMQRLIQQYGGGGKPSWKGTLYSIFGRTMGDQFGENAETCTNLVETSKTYREPIEESHRHRRVV